MPAEKPFVGTSFNYETLEETLDIKPREAQLLIGIPKENSFQENRIALTPDAISVLTNNGHRVVVEHRAGEGAHFSEKDYSDAGAKIAYDKKEVFQCDLIMKSAPVNEEEVLLLRHNQTIISPIHLPVMKTEILQRMMEKRITA